MERSLVSSTALIKQKYWSYLIAPLKSVLTVNKAVKKYNKEFEIVKLLWERTMGVTQHSYLEFLCGRMTAVLVI